MNKPVMYFDECTIYYESWQLQCCGEPFAVGQKVEWTCVYPSDDEKFSADFLEEHHGNETHSITGTVDRIIAERSEVPGGTYPMSYNKDNIIKEDLQKADGRESYRPDDDQTCRVFWGYVVTLKDVTLKPITIEP